MVKSKISTLIHRKKYSIGGAAKWRIWGS